MSGPPEIVIEVDQLDFSFGEHQVLTDVTLRASSSTRLGVVGESGSGKTTLGRLMVGALAGGEGAVNVNGRPWTAVARRSDLRKAVQMIHQDPYAALNSHLSALSAVSEAVRVCQGLPRREARLHALGLLDAVGVGRAAALRRPRRLSGGQCQRVAIARALAADPSVIVADEPTSSLDISVQAQILNLLITLGAGRSFGLVLISHDLAVIRHITDEVVVMRDGRIVEAGRTREVLARPSHPYTRQLVSEFAPADGPA